VQKTICLALRGASLAIWLGGGVMLLIVAQHVFFGGLVDKTTAGDIMASIFHTAGFLKIGLAAIALAAHFGLGKDPKARKTGFIALLIATSIALFAALYLEPKMVELRTHFRGSENLNSEARQTFKALHGGSMGLALIELICTAVALICAVL